MFIFNDFFGRTINELMKHLKVIQSLQLRKIAEKLSSHV